LRTRRCWILRDFGRNLLAAEAAAGVRHHVALSIVGTDRTPENGYFPRQGRPRETDRDLRHPYTIVRSTQFLEFLGAIAASSTDGTIVGFRPGLFQPIAADDVAASSPRWRSRRRETARRDRRPPPGTSTVQRIVARYLKAVGDPREVRE